MSITYETHRTTTVKRRPGRPAKQSEPAPNASSETMEIAVQACDSIIGVLQSPRPCLDNVAEVSGMVFVVGYLPKAGYDLLMSLFYRG